MAYSSFSKAGTLLGPQYNGSRPPYKMASIITMPDITGRVAPGFSGDAGKCLLIRSVSIAVGGYSTSSASSQFGVWNSNGTAGYFSPTFTLPNTGTGIPAKINKTLTAPKPVAANNSYYLGFLKRTTSMTGWAFINTGTGTPNIRQDTTDGTDSSNFNSNSSAKVDASLSYTVYYDALPDAPNSSAASASGTTINLSWASPTLVSGEIGISGYRIQRSTDNASWSTIVGNTGAGVLSYADTNLAWATTYYYRIAAHNEVSTTFGDAYSGPYAASVSATTATQPAPPPPDPTPGKAISLLNTTVADPNPVSVAFSDVAEDGIVYEDIQVVYGSEYLYNRITATARDLADDPVTVNASTPVTTPRTDSQAVYGIRGYDIGADLLNRDLADVTKVANRILYKTYQPNLRVESITVRLNQLSNGELISVLEIDIDAPVTVSFTPNGIGAKIYSQGRVIGISHNIGIESHTVTFRLESIANSPIVLNTSSFGELDRNVLG